MATGRDSRKDRLTSSHAGVWFTSSQDYVVIATKLFAQSAVEAAVHRGNASAYVFSGLPMLFSALRALLIECNDDVYGVQKDRAALTRLANEQNELGLLRDNYHLSINLLEKLSLLYEIRNEIIHPAHRPSGAADSTPDYIRPLKALGALNTTNDPNSDYPWMFQLQSHRLFRLAFSVIEEVVSAILKTHGASDPEFRCPNLPTYAQYKHADL